MTMPIDVAARVGDSSDGRVRDEHRAPRAGSADLAKHGGPTIRGALLWALQLARRPGDASDAAKIAKVVEPMLDDPDPMVRRRAATSPATSASTSWRAALARRCARRRGRRDEAPPGDAGVEQSRHVVRGDRSQLAAILPRCGSPPTSRSASSACPACRQGRRRDPARRRSARARRRIERADRRGARCRTSSRRSPVASEAAQGSRRAHCAKPAPKWPASSVARSPPTALIPLASDDSPSVRGAALWALGKLGDAASEKTLLAAFRDEDETIHERAAAGLLRLGTPDALAQAIAFTAGHGDPAARVDDRGRAPRSPAHAERLSPVIDSALAKVHADDPAFEPLVRLKLATHVAQRRGRRPIDVDAEIATRVPELPAAREAAGVRHAREEPAHRRVAVPHDGESEGRRPVAADHAVDEGPRELRPRVARPAYGRPAARSGARCSTTSTA